MTCHLRGCFLILLAAVVFCFYMHEAQAAGKQANVAPAASAHQQRVIPAPPAYDNTAAPAPAPAVTAQTGQQENTGNAVPTATENGFTETQPPQVTYDSSVADTNAESQPPSTQQGNTSAINENAVENSLENKLRDINKALTEPESSQESRTPQHVPASENSTLHMILQSSIALAIVVALILLVSGLLRRFSRHSPLMHGADLATILGKLYLSPKNSLFFIQTGQKVLLVGVTPTSISLVAEFDQTVYQQLLTANTNQEISLPEPTPPTGIRIPEPATRPTPGERPATFAEALKRTAPGAGTGTAPRLTEQQLKDADIATLRRDIQRLQGYLKDKPRETGIE